MPTYPHIGEINGRKVLMVKDQPFIMLAGEVHNSNSSSLAYMEGIWDQAMRNKSEKHGLSGRFRGTNQTGEAGQPKALCAKIRRAS